MTAIGHVVTARCRVFRSVGSCFAVAVFAVLCGCSSDVSVRKLDRSDRDPAVGWQNSWDDRLLVSTSNYLAGQLLTDKFNANPDEVITAIDRVYRESPQSERRLLEVLTDLCFVRGCELERTPDRAIAYFTASAYYSYRYMFGKFEVENRPDQYNPTFFLMTRYYRLSLLRIFDFLNDRNLLDADAYRLPGVAGREFLALPPENQLSRPLSAYSAGIEPCDDFEVSNLLTTARSFGVGLPLVARTELKTPAGEDGGLLFETPVTPATMQLDFVGDSNFRLRFFPALKVARITVDGGVEVPLEIDISTPIAVSGSGGGLWVNIHNMLNPDELRSYTGLYLIGDYDPDKIPVILVHGLMSNPQTWVQMVNYLLSDVRIRSKYQFLFFYYSTGQPVLYSAALLRRSLYDFRRLKDPEKRNPNFERTIMIGHSMGGLLSKTLIQTGDRDVCRRLFGPQIDNLLAAEDPEKRQFVNELLLFEPVPFVARVIFISTPHRGSEMATWRIARWGASLVKMPKYIFNKVCDSIDVFLNEPVDGEAASADTLHVATGIENLDPDNPVLVMLNELKSDGVPYHSIIGNEYAAGIPDGSDGVVPYRSSHLNGARSEMVVKSDHSAHQTAPAIEEVRRILLLHLNEKAAGQ